VLFNDAIDDGKTQARPLSDLFCGKKRLKNPIAGLLAHTHAGILDRDNGIPTRFAVPMGLDKLIVQFKDIRPDD
jgi:hypothetical protein